MCDQAFHYNVKTKRTFKISAKKTQLLLHSSASLHSSGILRSLTGQDEENIDMKIGTPFLLRLFLSRNTPGGERPRLSLGSRQLHTVTPLHAILQAAIFF
ncbi:hypothetical protein PGTUg99_027155 [Puccinia graminis f. sp. tritici]|uniref:Uncharacterized protein n=1 Tax=Puccinia graminis f. sp. tritici TaxID=56615 RepID=A0A5B0SA60_PUCGR|nr:hypothetical protein PGTUg99_027155 [Puccinia graminis f. sp. tritici]